MAKVIAVTGAKGGVGKSTLSIQLAAYWHEQGRKVVLLDADPQGTARTWAAVAAESTTPGRPTFPVVGPSLRNLPALREANEIVVIDCPPRSPDTIREALSAATLAVVPVGQGAPDVWSIGEALEALRSTPRAFVLSRHTSAEDSAAGDETRKALLAAGADPVMKTRIHERPAYREALAAGRSVAAVGPRTAAAREVRSLADELASALHKRKGSP